MNINFHRTLFRQITKHLGGVDAIPAECADFIKSINDVYVHFDEDRVLMERSLELSSKELSEYASLLKSTLESTTNAILVVSRESKATIFNQRFATMWGIPEKILNTRDDNKMLEFVLPQLKDPNTFLNKVRKLNSQLDTESYDILEFKNGRVFERYSKPQLIDDKSVGRVWSFRDITDQKHAEETVKEKIVEIEKINKFMVDRELKMVDLKTEITLLKDQVTELKEKTSKFF